MHLEWIGIFIGCFQTITKVLDDSSFTVIFISLGGQCGPQVPAAVCQRGVQPHEEKDGQARP